MKARAIVKRRKVVRNIRKITKTMQMISTAKFQRALKRAVGTKPYTQKISDLVLELADAVGEVQHPMLRRPRPGQGSGRVAVLVITSNRGLAGAYNSNLLRTAAAFISAQEQAGQTVELYVAGRKGAAYFNFRKRPIVRRYDQIAEQPKFADIEQLAEHFMGQFAAGQIDALQVVSMNFISTGSQKPRVLQVLPLAGVREAAAHIAREAAEKEGQVEVGTMDLRGAGEARLSATPYHVEVKYDFSPGPSELMDYLLPLVVKTKLFQCFLDATSSENVARMVAMKSATDNADKMVRSLTMQYNRARQSQITTELSEIMGGVEAMRGRA